MKIWKRNAVAAAIILFVCAAVYLNWSYGQQVEEGSQAADGKLLGEAALVSGSDELLSTSEDATAAQTDNAQQTGYFSSARLNRQQARDSALSLLQEAADEAADQTMIEQANESIQTMAANTLSEAQIENLITAKGYADCICFIGDSSASIVVAATETGLEDSDTARITEIVKEQTGLTAAQIKIIEAEQ